MQNRFLYVVILGMIFMLAPFAIDLYLPGLPTIADKLHTGIDEIEATIAVFLFGFAAGQLILGPLSDTVGRRNILIGGVALFTFASLMAGTAQSVEQLYAWRFVQALGGAGSVAVFPLVQDRFSETESAKIISYLMAMIVLAPLIAPIIGGYVLIFAGWRATFVTMAVLGAFSFMATTVFVRDSEQQQRRPFSLSSVLQGYGVVLSNRRIVLAILSSGLAFAGLFAFIAGSPFVYITFFGVPAEYYGYLVALNTTAMIAANLINAQLLATIEPSLKVLVGAIGFLLSGLSILVIAGFNLGLVPMVVSVIFFFSAMGIVETNAVITAFATLPEENGSVAALNGAFQFGIGAISSLIVSVIASTDAMSMAIVMAGSSVTVLFSAVLLWLSTPARMKTQ